MIGEVIDIDTMPAGRELDALVAEVMGWIPDESNAENFRFHEMFWTRPDGKHVDEDELPPSSTMLVYAWSAAETLGVCIDLTMLCDKRYFFRAHPVNDTPLVMEGDTPALAISRGIVKFARRKKMENG